MLHFKLWPRDRGCSQSHRTQRTSQMRCQGLGWPQDPFWSDKVKIWSQVFCFHLKRHSFPKTIISVKPIWGDFFFLSHQKGFWAGRINKSAVVLHSSFFSPVISSLPPQSHYHPSIRLFPNPQITQQRTPQCKGWETAHCPMLVRITPSKPWVQLDRAGLY